MKFLPRSIWLSALILVGMLVCMMYLTGGIFTYIQDDAYIHLAIAKNLAQSGTWGVNPGEFASASSSPLWIIILSLGYLLLGRFAEYLPLFINTAAVLVLVWLSRSVLLAYGYRAKKLALALTAIIAFTPLFPFAFGGMEHPLHMVAVILFVLTVGEYLSESRSLLGVFPWNRLRTEKQLFFFMVGLSPLVAGLRYEGIFVVFVASLFLLFAKKFRAFFAVAFAGALPIFAFAMWSVGQGGGLVPNTLLIKKKVAASFGGTVKLFFESAYQNIKMPLFMVFAPIGALSVYISSKRAQLLVRTETIAMAIITGTFVMQALFGRLSWVAMFRYEAYLIFAGLLIVFAIFAGTSWRFLWSKKYFSWMNVFLLGAFFIISLPFLRRLVSWPYSVMSAKNIHEQTRQVGNFLAASYPGEVVGASDIGLVAFPRKVTLIDFWGLANAEVMKARVGGTYGAKEMAEIAERRGVKVIAVFESWFGPSIPQKWIKVFDWTISQNVTTGGDTVSFYAPDCNRARELAAKRASYTNLSKQVKQTVFTAELEAKCSVDK